MEALALQSENWSKKERRRKEKGQAISTARTLFGLPEVVADGAENLRRSSRFFEI